MLAFPAIPALIQLIGFFFMPESPRWLVTHGKMDEAYKALLSINGGDEDAKRLATIELEEIKLTHDESEKAREEKGI